MSRRALKFSRRLTDISQIGPILVTSHDCAEDYAQTDYCEIDQFLPDGLWRRALGELEALFETQSRRRDILVKQSGNTPRNYSNLDRETLRRGSIVVPCVFTSQPLYKLLSKVVEEAVHPVPYLPEEYIASRLHRVGDIYGWHWDDYSWALVWVLKTPPENVGGSLEYIKRVPWNRAEPDIDRWVSRGPVQRRHPGPGSAYLLKSDTSLHRVSPLRKLHDRIIVVSTFASAADLTKEVDHSSMKDLFPDPTPSRGMQ